LVLFFKGKKCDSQITLNRIEINGFGKGEMMDVKVAETRRKTRSDVVDKLNASVLLDRVSALK
jgi:hypothetical protein